jgi:hypothetical protein
VIGGNYFLVKLSLLRKEKKIVNSLTAIWYGGNGNYKIQTIVSMNCTKKKTCLVGSSFNINNNIF